MNIIRHLTKIPFLVIMLTASACVTSLSRVGHADFLSVYGGPTYSSATGGYLATDLSVALYPTPDFNHVNDAGMVAATASKYDSAGNWLGLRAMRWSATTPATELGGDPNSFQATGINNSGAIIGSAMARTEGYPPFRPPGWQQSRPARWAASTTTATILQHPYIADDSLNWNYPTFLYHANDSGTAVGTVWKSHFNQFGVPVNQGFRPGRWDAAGTLTELGVLGTNPEGEILPPGWTDARAYAVNAAGAAAGTVTNWNHPAAIADQFAPFSAVRWDVGTFEATELQPLATTGNQYSSTHAKAINDAGIVVGGGGVFEANGNPVRSAAVRWDAAGNATELGNIPGTIYSSIANSARAINNAGTAVGISGEVSGNGGPDLGHRAIRWDSSSAAATELGHLGTFTDGSTFADAFALNAAGTAVGRAPAWAFPRPNGDIPNHAVYWAADDTRAIDLNTLIPPTSGWELEMAFDISDTGWIVGVGQFDPDGLGGQSAYSRNFLIHVPATAVIPGDFNGNGAVDAADYVVWRKTDGTPAGFNAWRAHFGTAGGSSAAASANAAVSEPASAVMLIFGAAVWSFLRRQSV